MPGDAQSDQLCVPAQHCHDDETLLGSPLVCLVGKAAASNDMEWEHVLPRHFECQCFVQGCRPQWRSDKVLWSQGQGPTPCNSFSREIADSMA